MLKRVVISRCEIDMADIKQQFQQKYGKTLESFIAVCLNVLLQSRTEVIK